MNVTDRFLHYVSFSTQSNPHAPEEKYPSSDSEWALLNALRDELRAMGLEANVDRFGYVTATLPANVEGAPAVAFISHVDTSPAVSGENVRPSRILYRGGDILLADGTHTIKAKENPELADYIGKELIVTDGTTLLGADDKAGVAEIMSAVAYFVAHPEEKHPTIKIAFTPDEEIGRGTDHFDVAAFSADFGFTVDGGALGEIEYENFNAAAARVEITGVSTHPGSAKGKMKNAIDIFADFHRLLPEEERPVNTEGYEGFFMADEIKGELEHLCADYIIRDHDKARFEEKKARFFSYAEEINRRYGAEVCRASVRDSYFNMADIIRENPHLIENAKAAMTACGVCPKVIPIRGGTDGARLSFMGLPCPNLSTGGVNFHAREEYVPVFALEKMTEVIVTLASLYAKGR